MHRVLFKETNRESERKTERKHTNAQSIIIKRQTEKERQRAREIENNGEV